MDIAKLKELDRQLSLIIDTLKVNNIVASATICVGIKSLPDFVEMPVVDDMKGLHTIGKLRECNIICDQYMKSDNMNIYSDKECIGILTGFTQFDLI